MSFGSIYGKNAEARTIERANDTEESTLTDVRVSASNEISKWDIFYYAYAILHHPEYRQKYAANLKRELPRLPFAPDFLPFANAGRKLAELHVNYENQVEYPLEMIENNAEQVDWTVEKMRYNKDKTQIIYNDFLTLGNIPPEAHSYRLGNRSALDWIVDQYKVSVDKRSGITNNPNREDDKQYIVRLIKKIVTISLETTKIVNSLLKISCTATGENLDEALTKAYQAVSRISWDGMQFRRDIGSIIIPNSRFHIPN